MTENETEHRVTPLETVARLQMAGDEYKKRRDYLRKKVSGFVVV